MPPLLPSFSRYVVTSFFQVRGDILRGVILEALLRNAADIVFGADDIPSYNRWLHALRLHVCHIARPKTILCVSFVACYCLTWLHVLVSSIRKRSWG
jgi:hypothetical protein